MKYYPPSHECLIRDYDEYYPYTSITIKEPTAVDRNLIYDYREHILTFYNIKVFEIEYLIAAFKREIDTHNLGFFFLLDDESSREIWHKAEFKTPRNFLVKINDSFTGYRDFDLAEKVCEAELVLHFKYRNELDMVLIGDNGTDQVVIKKTKLTF